MFISPQRWDWMAVALDTVNLNREDNSKTGREWEIENERNSRISRLALCSLSIPPCHCSGNGQYYLPIRRLGMWCISGGQLDGWRVAGREESCVTVLKIQLYMKSDIWSPGHSWERDIRVSTERCCSLCCLAESEVLPKGSDTRNSSSTNAKKEKNKNKTHQDSLLTIKTHAAIVDTLLVLASETL